MDRSRYPDLFIAIFEELGCSVKWKSKAWKVKRELLNLDLCVQLCNGEHIPFVLENKVKSIPRKNQLDEYAAKLKPTPEDNLILLSLATEFPDKKDIEKRRKMEDLQLQAVVRSHNHNHKQEQKK